MASKKGKKDGIGKYAQGMFVRQEQYAQRVKSHFDKAVEKLLDLARQVKDDIGEDEAFTFSDNPRVRDEATMAIRQLYSQVYGEIRNGVEAEWEYANLSCDAMVMAAFGKKCREQDVFARFFDRNRQAMDQFFRRIAPNGGMNLSQKVWKYTGDLRTEMENAITVSMGEGVSASTMSRRVRQYLQEPERLYRRVRGADGKLHLSKAAKAYHPGQGVYRSSYKNAMRLTRTETNAAYRLADEDRWQRMDFVVGMRVHKSNNHPTEDICDVLAGDYPKDFKFSAWHPQCRCFVTSILCTKEEMIQMQKNVLAGKSNEGFRSVNQVDDVPKAFKEWVHNNQERIVRAKALPYFLKDNGKIVDGKWVYKDDRISEKPHYISEEQFDKLSKTMSVTDKEKYVLYDSDDLYIDSSWSRTINSELAAAKVGRNVPDGFMDKGSLEQIRTLDSVIEKNTLPEDMWLYRKVYPQWLRREGVDFSVGSIVHEYGFTSTSAVEGANVMRKGKDVLLEIRAPKGTKAFVSANSAESEVILPRNSKFKVVSVAERDGNKVVRLDIVEETAIKYQGSAPSLVQGAKIKYDKAMERYGDLDVRYNNELNLENVVQVDGMAHREADSMNVNPQWGAEGGKRNCQASVAVYALRREGYMVRAAINDGSELFEKAEKNPEILWINKSTGTKPTLKKAGGKYVSTSRRTEVKSRAEMMSEFNELTKVEGLYQIMFDWNISSGGYGHTIVVERLNNGSLMVFDPQRGAHYKWREYVRKISSSSGIEILPLKELAFNPEYARILKKSKS